MTQQRSWRLPRMAVVGVLAAAVSLAACGSSSKSSTATGGSSSSCSGVSVGFFGALTGSSAALGINEANGTQLALEQFKKANPKCDVGYEAFDSQGDPAQAPQLAQKAISNTKVVALVGPAFSGESKQANPLFNEAGLPIITASATNPKLSQNGWKIFHRAVGNDNAQGPAGANYLTSTVKAKKVAVIDEGSEYGKGIADIVRDKVKSGGATVAVSDTIDAKGTDYSNTVNKVKAATPDGIFFGGYYDEAGRLLKQLRDGGVTAPFVAGDGSNDEGLIKGAGQAAEGATLLAPAGDITKVEGGKDFTSAYQAKFGKDPGLYSAEAFDAANHILAAIKAGKTTRKDINDYIKANSYKGITKTYEYDDKGELKGDIIIYAYKVQSGKIVFDAPVK